MTILVTGGAGFIGSNFIIRWFHTNSEALVNVDKLSYAGNIANLNAVSQNPNYHFVKTDIANKALISRTLEEFQPRAIIHFAAESHVDRSISDPVNFALSNIEGAVSLFDATLAYWQRLSQTEARTFRIINVSTDEVFGSLGPEAPPFVEKNAFKPNSPYSASKASCDHFARSYANTYSLPIITTHCSNNYGPYQYPEKLIPVIIDSALNEKAIPIYGDGNQIRDWLHVFDHCDAILAVLERGRLKSTYNIGGGTELTNLELVRMICEILDELSPRRGGNYSELISFVADRLGHDVRYAINSEKILKELHWKPKMSFNVALRETVEWYIQNDTWLKKVKAKNKLGNEKNRRS